ncbi:MAG: DUF4388 domain-containing protein [Acidobacteriota bacterium]
MALEGTLRDFSLADIFQLIGLQRKTGVLTLRAPEDVVTISFLEGRVVGADSLNKRLEDRLGQVLLKSRLAEKAELERALKTQMETLERLGHILLRNGALSRDELRKALEQQILQIVFRVFRWQDGDYHFSQETSIDYDQELVTPMSTESILMEGARMLDEWPIIERRIPHRGIVFVRTPAARLIEVSDDQDADAAVEFELNLEAPPPPAPAQSRIRLTQQEADILTLVDGVATVDDVIKVAPISDFETCKSLYNLLTRGLIREATREELDHASQAISGQTAAVRPPLRVPWLAFVALPLLAASVLLSTANPFNPAVGKGPKIVPRVASSVSWARMWGLWQLVNAKATLEGSFPDTVSAMAQEGSPGLVPGIDPWGNPYRYVLREDSVLLGGSTPAGLPDPNLLLFRHLGTEESESSVGPGAVLEH